MRGAQVGAGAGAGDLVLGAADQRRVEPVAGDAQRVADPADEVGDLDGGVQLAAAPLLAAPATEPARADVLRHRDSSSSSSAARTRAPASATGRGLDPAAALVLQQALHPVEQVGAGLGRERAHRLVAEDGLEQALAEHGGAAGDGELAAGQAGGLAEHPEHEDEAEPVDAEADRPGLGLLARALGAHHAR